MLKKLFSHTAIYGLAPQITKIASFFALPFLTAELADLDYGVSGVILAYTTAISALSTLGLRIVLVNTFFKHPGYYKWVWRQLYGFLSFWSILYALLLGMLIYFIVPEIAIINRWWIVFLNVGPLVLFGQTSTICSTYYQLNGKPLPISIRSITWGFLSVGLNLLFIVKYQMGYMGWFWSNFITEVIINASYFYPLNFNLKLKPIFNFKLGRIKNSLKVSLPMVPHYYSSYLLDNSDKMIMDLMNVNTGSIGKYNVSYTVANVMNSIGIASGMAIGPILSNYYQKKDETSARNLVFILQILFFLMTFIISIWMKELFGFLIRNAKLASMYYLGIILVMGYNYRPMYLGASSKIMFFEKTNVIWKVSFIAGIINVLFNLILIPIYGFEIAAVTTFIGYLYMGFSSYFFRTFKDINNINYHPALWIISTLLLTYIAYNAVEFSFAIKITISVVICSLSFYLVRHINKSIEIFE